MFIIMLAFALEPAVQTVVPQTPTSETMDSYELACTIADSSWKTHRVNLVQTGGRAFISPDGEGKPAIYRTFIELRVTTDETGKLAGMGRSEKLLDRPGLGYATFPVEVGGNNGRATITVSEVSSKQFAITVVHIDGGDRSPYAGFCNVKVIPQSPLTEVETKEYIRNPYGLPNR